MNQLIGYFDWTGDKEMYCDFHEIIINEPTAYKIVHHNDIIYIGGELENRVRDEYNLLSGRRVIVGFTTFEIIKKNDKMPLKISSDCSIFYDDAKISINEFLEKVSYPATIKVVLRLIKNSTLLYSRATHITVHTPYSSVPKHFLDMLTPESKKCSICTEFIEANLYMTKCYHLFHKACITKWISENTTCPICRTRQ